MIISGHFPDFFAKVWGERVQQLGEDLEGFGTSSERLEILRRARPQGFDRAPEDGPQASLQPDPPLPGGPLALQAGAADDCAIEQLSGVLLDCCSSGDISL